MSNHHYDRTSNSNSSKHSASNAHHKYSNIIVQVHRDDESPYTRLLSKTLSDKKKNKSFSLMKFIQQRMESTKVVIDELCKCLINKTEIVRQHSHYPYMLGPPSATNKGKKSLVLDLDETLVHSSFEKTNHYDFCVPIVIQGTGLHVYVNKRPGVEYFLRCMAEKYELIVFTASLKDYADPVIDKIDPEGLISLRLYRESCSPHKGVFVKDLSRLGRNLKDSIIVDNSENSFLFHRGNAIHIRSYFDDKTDRDLIELIPFLEFLSDVHDVRPIAGWRKKHDHEASFEFLDHHNTPKRFQRTAVNKHSLVEFDSDGETRSRKNSQPYRIVLADKEDDEAKALNKQQPIVVNKASKSTNDEELEIDNESLLDADHSSLNGEEARGKRVKTTQRVTRRKGESGSSKEEGKNSYLYANKTDRTHSREYGKGVFDDEDDKLNRTLDNDAGDASLLREAEDFQANTENNDNSRAILRTNEDDDNDKELEGEKIKKLHLRHMLNSPKGAHVGGFGLDNDL